MDSNALAGGPNMGFFAFGTILLFGLVIQSNLRMYVRCLPLIITVAPHPTRMAILYIRAILCMHACM